MTILLSKKRSQASIDELIAYAKKIFNARQVRVVNGTIVPRCYVK